MTPEQLIEVIDAIEAKLAKGTPTPWEWAHDGYVWLRGADGNGIIDDGSAGGEYGQMTLDQLPTDWRNIAAAMNALPKQLTAARSKLEHAYNLCASAEIDRCRRGSMVNSYAEGLEMQSQCIVDSVAAMLKPIAEQFGVWSE